MAGCRFEDGHDHLYKLLLIGDSCVGKSSLLSRFTRGEFRTDHNPTTTNNVVARDVYVDGKIVKAQIVDIAGNHKYRDFSTDVQMQNVVGALIVYDVTRCSTFEDVERWFRDLKISNGEIEVTLIGNKTDLVKDSVTTYAEAGKSFAERVSVSLTETSAKEGINVEKVFAELITRIFRKVIKNDTMGASDTHASSFSSEDIDGKRTRFSEKQLKWGFTKLISLNSFRDAGNGCLYHDSCVFGAEAFVVPKYAEKDQSLSMINPSAVMSTHTWTIENFSAITENALLSEHFKVGKVKWKLSLYPKGCNTGKDTHVSIFLQVHDSGSLSDGWKIFAKYKIRVKQQCGGADEEIELNHWFHDSASGWGLQKFMLLSELGEAEKGFLLHDVLIVEAEILVVGMLKDFN
ncbi:TRAF-like family protein [Artemisia annua]|uniref:TRAF-like family protein n=1 Tax=Artemisia annua TaxID=35608 RepID=A0A2U1MMG2_ARTAN|nr:TRAF-like family protein [Artemisia annua]